MAEKLYWHTFPSALGKITVCSSNAGLREVRFGSAPLDRPSRKVSNLAETQWIPADHQREKAARLTRQAVEQIKEYLSGERRRFTVPLHLEGTPFQKKVWEALLRIPYGQTRSYQEIARQAGNSNASRAVGMANHSNPVAIIVPCHRVIASDGSLGGYGGGLERKSRMLRLEQRHRA